MVSVAAPPDPFTARQQQISALTAATANSAWSQMSASDIDSSWAHIGPRVLAVLQTGRASSLAAAAGYVQSTLDADGLNAPPSGDLDANTFLSSAPDGRTMTGLLAEAPIIAKASILKGARPIEALSLAGRWLSMISLTVIADTRREYIAADIAQRPKVTGWIRVLNPPSCYRCAILAGRWYRYDASFQRHPRCDCGQRAATEESAAGHLVDPYQYFNSLSKDEQERTFGRVEARAIREGGDIFRIANVKQRGLASAGSKRAIKYGTPTRKTIDEIFRTAGTRARAIQMMKDEGYITGPQNPAGNILGQREGFGQFGKGGKAATASQAVTQARLTGVRDPLNRHTMTSAERRLYDAKIRLDAAENQGIWLTSIGQNSADKFNRPQRVTAQQLATLRNDYANELVKLRGNPAKGIKPAPVSVQRLAAALGIRI